MEDNKHESIKSLLDTVSKTIAGPVGMKRSEALRLQKEAEGTSLGTSKKKSKKSKKKLVVLHSTLWMNLLKMQKKFLKI